MFINCWVAVSKGFSLIRLPNSLVLGAVQSQTHISCPKCFPFTPLGYCTGKWYLNLLIGFVYFTEIFWRARCYTLTRNQVMAGVYFSQCLKAYLCYHVLLPCNGWKRKECLVPVCVHSKGKFSRRWMITWFHLLKLSRFLCDILNVKCKQSCRAFLQEVKVLSLLASWMLSVSEEREVLQRFFWPLIFWWLFH